MTERPILFSAPMVRAILAGAKTQTRRALHPDLFISSGGAVVRMKSAVAGVTGISEAHCPYWRKPGDKLWVRETFVQGWPEGADGCPDQFDSDGNERPMTTWYRASNPGLTWCTDGENTERTPWRPSIHMPRAASRITLDVTGVRVERLKDISEADALAEGIGATHGGYGLPAGEHFHASDPRQSYLSLWEAINGPGSVEANPLVWVVEFRRAPAGGA